MRTLALVAALAAATAPRKRILVDLVIANEDPVVVANLEFFLRHGATRAAAADVTYRVTFNGETPLAAARVRAHNDRAAASAELAPVRTLRRQNEGYDFGGHLDALVEEAACCGGGTCAPLAGGVAMPRVGGHARCYIARYPGLALDGVGAARAHYDTAGRPEGRRFACDARPLTATCGGRGVRVAFEMLKYDVFVFLNAGVRGPFAPTYMPAGWHWTSAFADRVGGGPGATALVGTSLVCLDEAPAPHKGGVGPRVEGFAFALARRALLHVLANGTSFAYHQNKRDAVTAGEYALSQTILDAPFAWNVGSLLADHRGLDFRDRANWNCNRRHSYTRAGGMDGVSVHPLEVLFHKARWRTIGQAVSARETEVLTRAMDRPGSLGANMPRRRRGKRRGAPHERDAEVR